MGQDVCFLIVLSLHCMLLIVLKSKIIFLKLFFFSFVLLVPVPNIICYLSSIFKGEVNLLQTISLAPLEVPVAFAITLVSILVISSTVLLSRHRCFHSYTVSFPLFVLPEIYFLLVFLPYIFFLLLYFEEQHLGNFLLRSQH